MDDRADEKETARIEAFSDGVFAIAITLLILEIKVPQEASSKEALTKALVRQWPSYGADHGLLVLNALLLLAVVVVPFPTALLAAHWGHPGEKVAAIVYSGLFVVVAAFFNLLWRYAAGGNRRLLRKDATAAVQAITRQYSFGPLLYLLCLGLAFVNVVASVAGAIALAIFFALPPKARPDP
jgi:uncharacterized membrane protein